MLHSVYHCLRRLRVHIKTYSVSPMSERIVSIRTLDLPFCSFTIFLSLYITPFLYLTLSFSLLLYICLYIYQCACIISVLFPFYFYFPSFRFLDQISLHIAVYFYFVWFFHNWPHFLTIYLHFSFFSLHLLLLSLFVSFSFSLWLFFFFSSVFFLNTFISICLWYDYPRSPLKIGRFRDASIA